MSLLSFIFGDDERGKRAQGEFKRGTKSMSRGGREAFKDGLADRAERRYERDERRRGESRHFDN